MLRFVQMVDDEFFMWVIKLIFISVFSDVIFWMIREAAEIIDIAHSAR